MVRLAFVTPLTIVEGAKRDTGRCQRNLASRQPTQPGSRGRGGLRWLIPGDRGQGEEVLCGLPFAGSRETSVLLSQGLLGWGVRFFFPGNLESRGTGECVLVVRGNIICVRPVGVLRSTNKGG